MDRLNAELRRQGLGKRYQHEKHESYDCWNCITDKDSVVRSISQSHKQIVRYAKQYDLPSVPIMEDDVWMPSETAWNTFLTNTPNSFDIWLAGAYNVALPPLQPIETGWSGMHCYIVHKRFYDAFLSVDESKHLDTALSALNPEVYLQYPMAAIQYPGQSATLRKWVDYNLQLKTEDVLGYSDRG